MQYSVIFPPHFSAQLQTRNSSRGSSFSLLPQSAQTRTRAGGAAVCAETVQLATSRRAMRAPAQLVGESLAAEEQQRADRDCNSRAHRPLAADELPDQQTPPIEQARSSAS